MTAGFISFWLHISATLAADLVAVVLGAGLPPAASMAIGDAPEAAAPSPP